jgi:NTP pyrophosphatase (non-canonical NTP hydrolase)
MRTNDKRASERLTRKLDDHDWSAEDIGGILDACLGLSGEVGELTDMVKKWIFHEAEIDMVHLKKELGDVCWYIAMFCESCGWDLDDVLQTNVDKLKARYPDGFDPSLSAHRKEGDI